MNDSCWQNKVGRAICSSACTILLAYSFDALAHLSCHETDNEARIAGSGRILAFKALAAGVVVCLSCGPTDDIIRHF